MTYYLCGGLYSDPAATREQGQRQPRKFSFVAPTRGLPYVRFTEEAGHDLWRMCQHHSHLYMVDDTLEYAVLEQTSAWCPTVLAPGLVKLTPEMREQVQAAISQQRHFETEVPGDEPQVADDDAA
jgi:hypothetical protein